MYKLNENTSGTKRETDTSVERQKTRKRERERESSGRKFSGEQSGKSGALKIKS